MGRIRESDGTNESHLESANSANGPQCGAQIGCLVLEMNILCKHWRWASFGDHFDRFYPNVGVKMWRLMQLQGLYLLGCISSIHVSGDCATISRSGLNSHYPVSQINPQIARDRSGGNGFDAVFQTSLNPQQLSGGEHSYGKSRENHVMINCNHRESWDPANAISQI